MRRNLPLKDVPVWKCAEESCAEQWVAWDEERNCPYCHVGRGAQTGFTYGELVEVSKEFGFRSEVPALVPVQVPELVPLTSLPQDTWVGLPVFHPCSQDADGVNWLLYDVGVVVDVMTDAHDPDELQCVFIVASGLSSTLTYRPANLWVPNVLAKRLKSGANSCQTLARVWPNPSLKRSAIGRAPGPRGCHAYHHPRGPGTLPLSPA